jgi:hypothetical protein
MMKITGLQEYAERAPIVGVWKFGENALNIPKN